MSLTMTKSQLGEILTEALTILDHLTIYCERDDKDGYEKTAGTARAFLDTLPSEVQASFPDWHPHR